MVKLKSSKKPGRRQIQVVTLSTCFNIYALISPGIEVTDSVSVCASGNIYQTISIYGSNQSVDLKF